MQVLERLINQTWRGHTVSTEDEALAAIAKDHYDIVLFSSGLTQDEEAVLQKKLSAVNPALIFIQHMGGGSGLLENEILAALDKREKQI